MNGVRTERQRWFSPADLDIEIDKTGYLSMDLSVSAIEGERSRVSGLAQQVRDQNVLLNCQRALEASRSAGIYVVHVKVAFRSGYPEFGKICSPFWVKVRESAAYLEGIAGTEICKQVAPQKDELIITKKTVDPFVYSDLDKILRVRGITHLIVTGVATSNVVEGTVRAASDRGYLPIVLEDCTADYTKELHKFQIKYLLPMHSIVSNPTTLSY